MGDANSIITIEIAGDSMSPTLKRGETVSIRRGLPRLGEVVAFQARDTILIHRVIDAFNRKGIRYFIHRGDASKKYGVFAEHELIGVAIDVQRRSQFVISRLLARLTILRRARKVSSPPSPQ